MSVLYHTIRGGETLQSISMKYYGSASRWRVLVTPNDLRPPYISDDIADTYGLKLAGYTLAQTVTPGASRLVLKTGDPEILRLGARLLLIRRSTTSRALTSDTMEVLSYSAGAVNLKSKVKNTYYAGTEVGVYAPEQELKGRVLRSGGLLLIPGKDGDLYAPDVPTDNENLYGRDISVTRDGYLQITAAGDLVIASGNENLIQQLIRRVRTVQGTLVRHPEYGCRAEQFIGQAAIPDTLTLIEAWTGLALSRDVRVESVEYVTATMEQDAIRVRARVRLHDETADFSLAIAALR
jgi:phage baseplate assembly protein W